MPISQQSISAQTTCYIAPSLSEEGFSCTTHTMCIYDTSREHCLSCGPRGGFRHQCMCLDTRGSIDTIVSLRRAISHPSTCPPSCLHPVSATPELMGDANDALPSAITTVITRDRHCPDIANISTQCATIEIQCQGPSKSMAHI